MRIFALQTALVTFLHAPSLVRGCMEFKPGNIVLTSEDEDLRLSEEWNFLSHNGKCQLTFENDGNLSLERKRNASGEWKTRWESGGGHDTSMNFFLSLNKRGKLTIYEMKDETKKVVFSTNEAALTGEEADKYVLGIGVYTPEEYGGNSQKCDLRIQSFSGGVCTEEWVNLCGDVQENVVMRSDNPDARRFHAGEENAHVAKNGKCRLHLKNDGNLLLEGRKTKKGNWMTYWESGGGHSTDGYYVAALTKKGNLLVFNENDGHKQVVFSTNTGTFDPSISHELSILTPRDTYENIKTVPCRLQILNSPNEESSDRCSERWTNIKDNEFHPFPTWGKFDPSLTTYDVLQKGEMFVKGQFNAGCAGDNIPKCGNLDCPYLTLYLDPTCNLVVFDGPTLAERGNTIWSADIQGSNPDDCYLLADIGGVKLFEGKYNKKREDAGEKLGTEIYKLYDPTEPENFYHVRLCNSGPQV